LVKTHDIAWLAGILEGEGCFVTPTRTRRSESVQITQKEPWILHRISSLVGGKVKIHRQSNGSSYFRWNAFGSLARGISMTVFAFMSPHRKEQIGSMLCGRKDYTRGPYRLLHNRRTSQAKGE